MTKVRIARSRIIAANIYISSRFLVITVLNISPPSLNSKAKARMEFIAQI